MARHQQHPTKARATSTLAVAALFLLVGGAAASTCDQTLAGTLTNQDRVNQWDKTCAEANNWKCPDCDLWNDVSRPAGKNGAAFAYSGTKPYRAKILPTVDVTGIESIVSGSPYDKADKATYFLWKQALGDVSQKKIKQITQPVTSPVIYINSLTARTRHQWHAHVGQPTSNSKFFNCAQSVINNPPQLNKWSAPIQGGDCTKLHAGGFPVSLIGTVVAPNNVNRAIREGFGKVMTTVKDITKDPAGMRSGVLVTPTKGGNVLLFIVTGANDYTIFGDGP